MMARRKRLHRQEGPTVGPNERQGSHSNTPPSVGSSRGKSCCEMFTFFLACVPVSLQIQFSKISKMHACVRHTPQLKLDLLFHCPADSNLSKRLTWSSQNEYCGNTLPCSPNKIESALFFACCKDEEEMAETQSKTDKSQS